MPRWVLTVVAIDVPLLLFGALWFVALLRRVDEKHARAVRSGAVLQARCMLRIDILECPAPGLWRAALGVDDPAPWRARLHAA